MEDDEATDESSYSISPLVTPGGLALSDSEKAEALADNLETQFQPVTGARSHVRRLQVLQSKCLHLATGAPWYVSNRQIHEDLGVPLFADHIRALTESFNSKLAHVGNPLVRQLGRYLN